MSTDAYNNGDGTKGTNYDDPNGLSIDSSGLLSIPGFSSKINVDNIGGGVSWDFVKNKINDAIDDAYDDGYDDGYADGYADGFKDGVDSVYNN